VCTIKDNYHWHCLCSHQMLSLLVTPHSMQYWQSIRLALMCQCGKQKDPM